MIQDENDLLLAEMWYALVPIREMAERLGYKHSMNVSHRARELGLPRRTGKGFYEPKPAEPRQYRCQHCGGLNHVP